jgi:hypothetical protein
MSQAWGTAVSVVIGVAAGVLTNLITSNFTVPLAVALGTTVAAWAVLTFVLHRSSAAGTATSVTYGAHSPIINAPDSHAPIIVNSFPSGFSAPGEDGGRGVQ